ncbi:MAG: glycoside hydrolase family 57 protein [Phycisphaerales bacterium]|nr:glycoside hydrolase family 57 protein [Phycisphaerales bacterium]
MTAVCFYFQVHQPCRLRRYSVFSSDPFYFDNEANREILLKVADKCYRPATTLLLDLIRRHEGRFRFTFSVTGTVLEQLQAWAPDVVDLFRQAAESGCVEFLGETSHHSLAALWSPSEFKAQVEAHTQRMQDVLGVTPVAFRNTELIFSDEVAQLVQSTGTWRGMLCEGVERLLQGRSPNYAHHAACGLPLLLKNFQLSDDIAFRFSNQDWSQWPLSAEQFARWVDQINGDGFCCNLFMDYETFGEHQWADTGIFDFLDALPEKIFDVQPKANGFMTVSEALEAFEPVGSWLAPTPTSWADTERDLSAWLGNDMQTNAGAELYRLEGPVKVAHGAGDPYILEDWRKLTTSDHLYYMCTKYWADGDVHKYFSPYDSPYDAYINFMNVLDNLRTRAEG